MDQFSGITSTLQDGDLISEIFERVRETDRFHVRLAFRDITEKTFIWTEDRSYDGGKSWAENITTITNKRVE